jgi:hypothetical protein
MKKILVVTLLVASTLAAARDDTAIVAKADDEAVIAAAKVVVASGLKDPDSAQFRNIFVRQGKTKRAICGEVNAKNSYGGYIGYRTFTVLEGDTRALIKQGDEVMDPFIDSVCKRPAQ